MSDNQDAPNSGGQQIGSDIYDTLGQRIARQIHLYKAMYKPKERPRVQWLAQYIPSGGVIVDVGAHFGYFSKEFARLHGGSCRVFAFEPMAYNHDILQRVTRRFGNVQIINKALSDAAGEVTLYIPVKKQGKIGPGLAHFGTETQRDFVIQPVETVELDSLVGRVPGLDRVDFIKIDVEGAELLAFKGARGSLERWKPAIFTEVNDAFTRRVGYGAEALFQLLGGLGYSAWLVEEGTFRLTPVEGYTVAGDYLFRA